MKTFTQTAEPVALQSNVLVFIKLKRVILCIEEGFWWMWVRKLKYRREIQNCSCMRPIDFLICVDLNAIWNVSLPSVGRHLWAAWSELLDFRNIFCTVRRDSSDVWQLFIWLFVIQWVLITWNFVVISCPGGVGEYWTSERKRGWRATGQSCVHPRYLLQNAEFLGGLLPPAERIFRYVFELKLFFFKSHFCCFPFHFSPLTLFLPTFFIFLQNLCWKCSYDASWIYFWQTRSSQALANYDCLHVSKTLALSQFLSLGPTSRYEVDLTGSVLLRTGPLGGGLENLPLGTGTQLATSSAANQHYYSDK